MASAAPPGAPLSLDAFLERLAAAGKNVRALRGEFVQRKRLAAFEKELTSRGRFELVRPAHLEWRYTDPDPSALVVEGDRATLSLPDEPPQTYDLTRQPGLAAILRQMRLWLGAEADLSRLKADYDLTLTQPKEGPILHLVPRTPALRARISEIEVAFDGRTLLPRSAQVTERSGDRTVITFVKVERR